MDRECASNAPAARLATLHCGSSHSLLALRDCSSAAHGYWLCRRRSDRCRVRSYASFRPDCDSRQLVCRDPSRHSCNCSGKTLVAPVGRAPAERRLRLRVKTRRTRRLSFHMPLLLMSVICNDRSNVSVPVETRPLASDTDTSQRGRPHRRGSPRHGSRLSNDRGAPSALGLARTIADRGDAEPIRPHRHL